MLLCLLFWFLLLVSFSDSRNNDLTNMLQRFIVLCLILLVFGFFIGLDLTLNLLGVLYSSVFLILTLFIFSHKHETIRNNSLLYHNMFLLDLFIFVVTICVMLSFEYSPSSLMSRRSLVVLHVTNLYIQNSFFLSTEQLIHVLLFFHYPTLLILLNLFLTVVVMLTVTILSFKSTNNNLLNLSTVKYVSWQFKSNQRSNLNLVSNLRRQHMRQISSRVVKSRF